MLLCRTAKSLQAEFQQRNHCYFAYLSTAWTDSMHLLSVHKEANKKLFWTSENISKGLYNILYVTYIIYHTFVKSCLDFPRRHQVRPIANSNNRRNQQKLRLSKDHPTNHMKSSFRSIDELIRGQSLSLYRLYTKKGSQFHLYRYSKIDMSLFKNQKCINRDTMEFHRITIVNGP